jgi:hypothetical protein
MSSLRRVTYTRPIPADAVRVTHKGQPAVRIAGPDGKPLTAAVTANGTRCRVPSPKWYGQYTNGMGVTVRLPLSENKDAARVMLNDLVTRARLERAGVVDPTTAHRKTTLRTHADDWLAVLTSRGRSEEYVALK